VRILLTKGKREQKKKQKKRRKRYISLRIRRKGENTTKKPVLRIGPAERHNNREKSRSLSSKSEKGDGETGTRKKKAVPHLQSGGGPSPPNTRKRGEVTEETSLEK